MEATQNYNNQLLEKLRRKLFFPTQFKHSGTKKCVKTYKKKILHSSSLKEKEGCQEWLVYKKTAVTEAPCT